MTARIDSIPDADWEKVREARDALIAEQRSCTPGNEAAIEAGVRASYRAIGEAEPVVLWVDGPLSVVAASAMLRTLPKLHTQLSDQLGGQLDDQLDTQISDQLGVHLYTQLDAQLDDQLDAQLDDQLRGQLNGHLNGQLNGHLNDQLHDQLRAQLDGQLHTQLYGQLYGQLNAHLRGQLNGQLRNELRGQLDTQLDDQLYGQLNAQLDGQLNNQLDGLVTWGWRLAWTQHYLTVNTLTGVTPIGGDLRRNAEHWRDALKCHAWIPLRGVAIMTKPHVACHVDNQGRLHNTSGAAWAWADGTAVHAIDGIRVPAWVIDNPDPARFIDDLDNVEQRRVAFKTYGWDRAVEHLNLEPIDANPDQPHLGDLYRLPDTLTETPATLLLCRNASPHLDGTWETYGLLASPEAETAEQAQASLAGLTVTEWRELEVQT